MLPAIASGHVLPEPSAKPETPRLEKACMDFESIFINQMLKSSDSAIFANSGFLKGNDGKIIKSMFNEHLSETMSAGGGMGLGKVLFEQLAPK